MISRALNQSLQANTFREFGHRSVIQLARRWGSRQVQFDVVDRVPLVGTNSGTVAAKRKSLLITRRNDFVQQLQRQ